MQNQNVQLKNKRIHMLIKTAQLNPGKTFSQNAAGYIGKDLDINEQSLANSADDLDILEILGKSTPSIVAIYNKTTGKIALTIDNNPQSTKELCSNLSDLGRISVQRKDDITGVIIKPPKPRGAPQATYAPGV